MYPSHQTELLRVSSHGLLVAAEPQKRRRQDDSVMCDAEKLFYVNIIRDDVKKTIAIAVWIIFFLDYLTALLLIFNSGDIKI